VRERRHVNHAASVQASLERYMGLRVEQWIVACNQETLLRLPHAQQDLERAIAHHALTLHVSSAERSNSADQWLIAQMQAQLKSGHLHSGCACVLVSSDCGANPPFSANAWRRQMGNDDARWMSTSGIAPKQERGYRTTGKYSNPASFPQDVCLDFR
jgi:hypothetical protein